MFRGVLAGPRSSSRLRSCSALHSPRAPTMASSRCPSRTRRSTRCWATISQQQAEKRSSHPPGLSTFRVYRAVLVPLGRDLARVGRRSTVRGIATRRTVLRGLARAAPGHRRTGGHGGAEADSAELGWDLPLRLHCLPPACTGAVGGRASGRGAAVRGNPDGRNALWHQYVRPRRRRRPARDVRVGRTPRYAGRRGRWRCSLVV